MKTCTLRRCRCRPLALVVMAMAMTMAAAEVELIEGKVGFVSNDVKKGKKVHAGRKKGRERDN